MSWLQSLSDEIRERVYAVMRTIDMEASHYDKKYRRNVPRHGESSAWGVAWFDDWIQSEVRREFLRNLRTLNPKSAAEATQMYAIECVKKHNAKFSRPNGYQYHRSENTAESLIAWCRQRVLEEANQSTGDEK